MDNIENNNQPDQQVIPTDFGMFERLPPEIFSYWLKFLKHYNRLKLRLLNHAWNDLFLDRFCLRISKKNLKHFKQKNFIPNISARHIKIIHIHDQTFFNEIFPRLISRLKSLSLSYCTTKLPLEELISTDFSVEFDHSLRNLPPTFENSSSQVKKLEIVGPAMNFEEFYKLIWNMEQLQELSMIVSLKFSLNDLQSSIRLFETRNWSSLNGLESTLTNIIAAIYSRTKHLQKIYINLSYYIRRIEGLAIMLHECCRFIHQTPQLTKLKLLHIHSCNLNYKFLEDLRQLFTEITDDNLVSSKLNDSIQLVFDGSYFNGYHYSKEYSYKFTLKDV